MLLFISITNICKVGYKSSKCKSKRSQNSISIIKENNMKIRKSFSSRKTSLTKDNSKNKISNL